MVTLVLEGALARRNRGGVCIGLAGPGDVMSLEHALGGDPQEDGLWLTSGRQIVIPAHRVARLDRSSLLEIGLADMRRRMEAACAEVNRQARGRVAERLAALLLDIHRLGRASEIPLRQSDLADLLAVRRAGISTASGELQAAGAIRVGRASIRLLDLAALERATKP